MFRGPSKLGEKWAWFTAFAAGGATLFGQLVLTYMAGAKLAAFYLQGAALLIVEWAIAVALSVKETFH